MSMVCRSIERKLSTCHLPEIPIATTQKETASLFIPRFAENAVQLQEQDKEMVSAERGGKRREERGQSGLEPYLSDLSEVLNSK
jgi:hypothetical protein